MRKFAIVISLLITFNCLADGGDPYGTIKIYNYESNLNLLYVGLEDTVNYSDNKNKIREREGTTNVVIYNITKDSSSYLFQDTIKRFVIGFHYETEFIEKYNTVEFNNEYNPLDNYSSGLFSFSNNEKIDKRPISNNLIIITETPGGDKTSIWIADKYGRNLQKAFEIDNSWRWDIDVKNRMIRIYRQANKKLEVKNKKY